MLKNETLFKNFSNEEFEWKYDGINYIFPAGSVKPLENVEALHFAKHLVDREMMRDKLSTNHHTRIEYEAKATEQVQVHTEPELAEEEVSSVISEKKTTEVTKAKEEVFEGLKK